MLEMQNDLTITTLLCFTLLILALIGLMVLLMSLLKHSRQQALQSQQLLTNLLHQQTAENQSLRNQLRAADVVSLHGLNAGTAVPQAASASEAWVPSYDESIVYQENLNTAGYGTLGPNDDLAARGWDPIVTSGTDGGNPVRT